MKLESLFAQLMWVIVVPGLPLSFYFGMITVKCLNLNKFVFYSVLYLDWVSILFSHPTIYFVFPSSLGSEHLDFVYQQNTTSPYQFFYAVDKFINILFLGSMFCCILFSLFGSFLPLYFMPYIFIIKRTTKKTFIYIVKFLCRRCFSMIPFEYTVCWCMPDEWKRMNSCDVCVNCNEWMGRKVD